MKSARMLKRGVLLLGAWAMICLAGQGVALAADSDCFGAQSSTGYSCTFSTAGIYTFTVPAGVTSLDVKAVGAAGGDGDAPRLVLGGEGASVQDTAVPVTPGQTLIVVVGGAGQAGTETVGGAGGSPGGGGAAGDPGGNANATLEGGGGGGYSGLLDSSANPLVIAGGGGGGGGAGGPGGDAGSQGTAGPDGGGGGGGPGTSTAGGAGGAGGFACDGNGSGAGSDGASLKGGQGGDSNSNASSTHSSGGGGGGGYYGGGGGGGGCFGGGGGGGSSFGVGPGLSNQVNTTDPASVSISYEVPVVSVQTVGSPNAEGWFTSAPVDVTVNVTEAGEPTTSDISSLSCSVDGVVQTFSNDSGVGATRTAEFPLSADGTHTISCTATDANGIPGTGSTAVNLEQEHPQVDIGTPASTTYYVDQVVTPSYSCSPAANGVDPGLASCLDSAGGSSASPGPVDTSSAGGKSYTVTATSQDGLMTQQTVEYTVDLRPSSLGVSCAPGSLRVGQTGSCTATVSDGVGSITPTGPVQFGSSDASDSIGTPCDLQPTGTAGQASCSVPLTPTEVGSSRTITASFGTNSIWQASSNTTDETVTAARPPTATIASPAGGHTYNLGQVVATSFSCHDAAGEPGIRTCVDSRGVTDGTGALDTESAGRHTYTVTAISLDGATRKASISYRVAGPPSVSIGVPGAHAKYTRGQVVTASYGCREGKDGPGISSCTGTVGDGKAINTDGLGKRSFRVRAVSKDGQETVQTVTYRVVRPSRQLTVLRVRPEGHGVFRVRVELPGPGTIDVLESAARHAASAAAARQVHPARGRFAVGRKHLLIRRAGIVVFTVHPSAHGRELMKRYGGLSKVRLWLTYKPTGGKATTLGIYGLHG
jgi:hypothetical protein